jgi:hypothetical protein
VVVVTVVASAEVVGSVVTVASVGMEGFVAIVDGAAMVASVITAGTVITIGVCVTPTVIASGAMAGSTAANIPAPYKRTPSAQAGGAFVCLQHQMPARPPRDRTTFLLVDDATKCNAG